MTDTVPCNVSSITSVIAQSTPWMYSAIPLTKSLVTLKTFLPITTGSMKLTSVVPEKNNTHSGQSSSELLQHVQSLFVIQTVKKTTAIGK